MTASEPEPGVRNPSVVMAYEELRGRVLSGSNTGDVLGVVHLHREGVSAWSTSISTTLCTTRLERITDPAQGMVPLGSDDIQAGVIRLLATMVLRDPKEMRA